MSQKNVTGCHRMSQQAQYQSRAGNDFGIVTGCHSPVTKFTVINMSQDVTTCHRMSQDMSQELHETIIELYTYVKICHRNVTERHRKRHRKRHRMSQNL